MFLVISASQPAAQKMNNRHGYFVPSKKYEQAVEELLWCFVASKEYEKAAEELRLARPELPISPLPVKIIYIKNPSKKMLAKIASKD